MLVIAPYEKPPLLFQGSSVIMRPALRQTNQRSGLFPTPDLFDHLIRLPRLVSLS
jgi:hypothetical protein